MVSDWDFLWEMKDRGYSTDEIMDAAACGYAPYEYPFIENDEKIDELFEAIEEDEDFEVTYSNIAEEEEAYLKERVFQSLVDNARQYFEITGRYLQIWGELGEFYAEVEYGLKRHKHTNQAGSDGIINGKLVEVKTISPIKSHNTVRVKKKGDFENLLIVRISKNFEFKAKLIPREKLSHFSDKFLNGKI